MCIFLTPKSGFIGGRVLSLISRITEIHGRGVCACVMRASRRFKSHIGQISEAGDAVRAAKSCSAFPFTDKHKVSNQSISAAFCSCAEEKPLPVWMTAL